MRIFYHGDTCLCSGLAGQAESTEFFIYGLGMKGNRRTEERRREKWELGNGDWERKKRRPEEMEQGNGGKGLKMGD